MSRAPLLVIGIGNPSRGDDALGPTFIDELEQRFPAEIETGQVELLTDFQLQIEHALDLAGRRQVIFVDASVTAKAPFEWQSTEPAPENSFTTHALSPAAVLETYQRILGPPPEAWTLAIRAERFELGEDLSEAASSALAAALTFFSGRFFGSGSRWTLDGIVQGVGCRPWVLREARALELVGRVFNRAGKVVVEAFGATRALAAFEEALGAGGPAALRIDGMAREELPQPATLPAHFAIEPSEAGPGTQLPLPPDLATCQSCMDEVHSPSGRHAGYPFTSCTECGPRFAIAQTLPFDRATTTMAEFALCDACRAEYEDPDDRRFHAQAIACARCGPRIWLCAAGDKQALPPLHPEGSLPAAMLNEAVLDEAARLLRSGKILALRGLGAFHLACDASQEEAVQRLRLRKRREGKPLAVMARDLEAARLLGSLSPVAEQALLSPARPIVIVPAQPSALAPAVLAGSHRVGLFLPYSPLHSLLLEKTGRPLVMTSANLSGEPVCRDNDEALQTLDEIADAFLLHNRPIARRVEDSVVNVTSLGVRPWRRARGIVPRAIRLPSASPEPVLALGGHLKNTVCLVVEDRAYLSPHLGDLHSTSAEAAWEEEVESLQRLLGVRPQVIAHDLHPDYTTTRYARRRSARVHHGVQHHVAHVLAATAELGLRGKVLGLAFDGSGYGPDGEAWGGEFLLVEGHHWQRLASFRPLPLLGGEAAVRQVWRQAYALLADAFGEEAQELADQFSCFADIPRSTLRTLEQMRATGVAATRARGVGRTFDAVGALALGLSHASFEGQVAVALEEALVAGDRTEHEPYPWTAPTRLALAKQDQRFPAEAEIDLRPMTRALTLDLGSGISPAQVAARFHATIARASAEVAERALAETGATDVVLTGGVFQNQSLETQLRTLIGPERVRLTHDVPVGDGGLALGQAWSAVLALRSQSEGIHREGIRQDQAIDQDVLHNGQAIHQEQPPQETHLRAKQGDLPCV